ncbi:hypothetical protein [Acetobacterium bakii]|uniref:Uncharacterized protein n=1 Tax=Acetobacterium bakii TaxID=52689 RepID=A0A0L6U0R9_9FIRM|nr:hypothetical protein [Acetobacterium bakii]KNZ41390.1 hypothetical protein AKG39_12275 [Acetobacterium bakii]
MLYDLTTLLSTVAGCTATIIAIIGGFVASKLITLSTERNDAITSLNEVLEELSFKQNKMEKLIKKVTEDDAKDFIRKNIIELIKNTKLVDLYKEEDRLNIRFEDLMPFWDKCNNIWHEVKKTILDKDCKKEDINEVGIPRILVKDLDDFDYEICKYAIEAYEDYIEETTRQIHGGLFMPSFNMKSYQMPFFSNKWYDDAISEIRNLKDSIDWLNFQKTQLSHRISALGKPKGMKAGLIIFCLYSIASIVIPLTLIPFTTYNYQLFICVKRGIITVFFLGMFFVFLYFSSLLTWKKEEPKEKL